MNTENGNDFSRCRVGDKLWLDPLDCEVTVHDNSHPTYINIKDTTRDSGLYSIVKTTGIMPHGYKQVLYFGKPQIIAPPEPPRLPDYKKGQWIAVWEDNSRRPTIGKFNWFTLNGKVVVEAEGIWQHHCTIEELPAVLEKWERD